MYDTALMPPSILSNITGLNGSDPITTHILDSASLQYATATFTIGGFTFNTAANAMDIPPTAGADQFTFINTPLAYSSRVAYGDATNFNAQGFHGYSGVETGIPSMTTRVACQPQHAELLPQRCIELSHLPGQRRGPAVHRFWHPDELLLYRHGSSVPRQPLWLWLAGFYNSLESYTKVNGELLLTTSYLTGGGADLIVTSAVTAGYHPADTDPSAVPEPPTLALAAIGSALVAVRRLRRN
jgi:hypothetical protein